MGGLHPRIPMSCLGVERSLMLGTLNVYSFLEGDSTALASEVGEKSTQFDALAVQEAPGGAGGRKQLDNFAQALGLRVAACRDADHNLANALLLRPELCVDDTQSWRLQSTETSEVRSAVACRWNGLTLVCTHLDAYRESTRLHQLEQLRANLAEWHGHGTQMPELGLVLMGDFNSLRREDYSQDEWEVLVQRRTAAGIKSQTAVTQMLQA